MKKIDSRIERMLDVIKALLWKTNEKPQIIIDRELYQDLREHSIVLMTAVASPLFAGDEQLKKQWKNHIYSQVMHNENIAYIENQLREILPCPYVILKGSAAAQYYPKPSLRTMGDIDLIVRPMDYHEACQSLIDAAFTETTSIEDSRRRRHRTFGRSGITIEVHLFFASMSNYQKAIAFESQIVDHIMANQPYLPDLSNGLVLLEHIAQHMRDGIGFRQILDWMMFVNQCITEREEWNIFCEMARKAGLERLAQITLQLCHDYLGLTRQFGCIERSNRRLSRAMLVYVYNCGNFGKKNRQLTNARRIKKWIKRQWLLFRLGITKCPKKLVNLNQEVEY